MQEDIKERLLWTGAFILVLALGFFAGRISVKIDQVSTVDPIKEVGEIATFVPTINFTSFDKGILYGMDYHQRPLIQEQKNFSMLRAKIVPNIIPLAVKQRIALNRKTGSTLFPKKKRKGKDLRRGVM